MDLPKKHLIITILLPVQVLIVQFISQKPEWIETYYSNGIYPHLSFILRLLFGWLPFSFGDLLAIILVFVFVKKVYKLIKNKFKNTLLHLLKFTSFLSVLYFCFYFFWGLNYFREPLRKNIGLQQSNYNTKELVKTSEWIIDNLNKCHFKITNNDTIKVEVPYSQKEIYQKTKDGFFSIAADYPQLNYNIPSIKNSLVSLLQSYNGTAGYLNPITGEAQVNCKIPKTGYPATACHEIAHQLGWSAENDANFVGFMASTANQDIYFQYSGYRMVFAYCIGEVRKRDKQLSENLLSKVNKGVLKDYRNSNLFWKQYRNPIEPYIKKGYNSYLKANNQGQGIESYNYVVDLLIAYHSQKDSL
ncbi:DUF3810 domain-containing protein [Tenacibaculum sp. IB213877]|uniref:DUF3810 domain-containing protein n=1 Tax=Tenacibaculum sp. IB213877 TaxID=3097351 RepID=UPI002A5A4B4A|nr:DUF3810 domain-containing protein [Tenacibaculum sp. IB213877]MDY0779445.1 DUF3810 domain-containing protein [Tenacibaculum sp. IB213877]